MDQAVNVLRLVTERLRTSFSIAYQLIECVTLHSFVRQLVYGLVFGARQPVGLLLPVQWLREQSGAEMILFVTPIIKSGAQIIAFAFETVISASPIINSVLEIIISAPDTIDFGFHMIDCELDTIISGLHMVIVKPSITNCVLVAVFLRTEIIIDKTEISIDAIVAVFSKAIYIPSFQ